MLMCKDKEYAKIHKPPIERLAWVLMKIDSDRRHKTDYFANKFIGKIENAFVSLPKSVDWLSFLNNDLRPYLKMDEDVKDVAVKHKLKKSQAKALPINLWVSFTRTYVGQLPSNIAFCDISSGFGMYISWW